MAEKPTYRVVVSDESKNDNGEKKNFYTEVGAGWNVKGGGISVKLRNGIALTGGFVLFPNTDRDTGEGSE